MIGKAPEWRITYGKSEGIKSEEVILLGQDWHQSRKHVGDLGNLLEMSNDKDEPQAHTKKIGMYKYLKERLLPPH